MYLKSNTGRYHLENICLRRTDRSNNYLIFPHQAYNEREQKKTPQLHYDSKRMDDQNNLMLRFYKIMKLR
jgi:hypothetical protein